MRRPGHYRMHDEYMSHVCTICKGMCHCFFDKPPAEKRFLLKIFLLIRLHLRRKYWQYEYIPWVSSLLFKFQFYDSWTLLLTNKTELRNCSEISNWYSFTLVSDLGFLIGKEVRNFVHTKSFNRSSGRGLKRLQFQFWQSYNQTASPVLPMFCFLTQYWCTRKAK